MNKYITESDMKFGPFEENQLLHIEKIPQYVQIQNGMHITEFVYYDKTAKKIISIEAKTTAPNPQSVISDNPQEKFKDYINTIREKFENSLDLYVKLALDKELPIGFRTIDYKKTDILFVLVIKEQRREWLPAVNEALNESIKSLNRLSKIWKCKVITINEEIARSRKIIV